MKKKREEKEKEGHNSERKSQNLVGKSQYCALPSYKFRG